MWDYLRGRHPSPYDVASGYASGQSHEYLPAVLVHSPPTWHISLWHSSISIEKSDTDSHKLILKQESTCAVVSKWVANELLVSLCRAVASVGELIVVTPFNISTKAKGTFINI